MSLIECLALLPAHLNHLPDPNIRSDKKTRTPKTKLGAILIKLNMIQEYTARGMEKFVEKVYLPFLKKANHARIINISSRKGSIHNINSGSYRILLPYQIAKCAQNMLTAGLNQELKETNIKTYSIHPGNLKTDVAPPDADTEPSMAAAKIYQWIVTDNNPPTQLFYSVLDDSIMEW
jgi:NAD(P)-dependent dehydrogenase (short-subunit alcohol dehydrogenase family)